jgi:hypothetical protein
MFHHGASMAEEGLVELFVDAMYRYVHDPTADGTDGERPSPRATERELDERLAATLAGAAAAFAEAGQRCQNDIPRR